MEQFVERLEMRTHFAAAPSSQDYLVSTPSRVEEYSPAGEFVRSIDILADGDRASGLAENRDLVVGNGKLWIYDGDFAISQVARIRSLDLTTGRWQLIESSPPWTTSNNGVNGNVGVVGDEVIFDALDASGNGRDPVRSYNVRTGEFKRAGGVRDYQDLVVGLDGLVYSMEYSYAVYPDGTIGKRVHVHDPKTLEEIRSVELLSTLEPVTCLAVDAAGDIYAGGVQISNIYHYNADGQILDIGSIADLNTNVMDMDVSGDARILIGTRGYGDPLQGIPGEAVIVGDTSLDHFDRRDFGLGAPYDTFVAFGSLGSVNPTVASIAGNAFNDVNLNGVRDAGEAALVGWQVFIDKNDDGYWESWDNEPAATTSSSGRYEFHDLAKGDYTIRILPAKNYIATTRQSYRVSVPLLGSIVKRFGFACGGIVQGYVFNDGNGNGLRDPGESGIFGARVFVDFDNDGVLDADEPSFRTGAAGRYVINGLRPGTYKVRQRILRGYLPTTPRAFTFTVGVGGSSTKRFGNIAI